MCNTNRTMLQQGIAFYEAKRLKALFKDRRKVLKDGAQFSEKKQKVLFG